MLQNIGEGDIEMCRTNFIWVKAYPSNSKLGEKKWL